MAGFEGKCDIPPALDRFLEKGIVEEITPILKEIAITTVDVIHKPGVCPVVTGDLRDHHVVEKDSDFEYSITNSMWYWPLVVYGGPHNHPNNYPTRAVADVMTAHVAEIFNHQFLTVLRG